MSHVTFTDVVSTTAKKFKIPGVAVGVFADGKDVYACHGVTSLDNPLPVDKDTLYVLGSLTKTSTATTIMRLVRRGEGRAGTFRMGLEHGLYCLGANWLLFVLLFALGIMNIAAMAVLTVLIFAEKFFPQAERIAWVAGLALILYGTLVIVVPAALLLNGAEM
jgi:Predicted metal-binding integral membrane protein (DUF2182)/Beta-lactamase